MIKMTSAQWNFDIFLPSGLPFPQNCLLYPLMPDKSSWLDRRIVVKYLTAGAVCWQQSM